MSGKKNKSKQNSLENKKKILAASEELFSKKGFDATGIDEIASLRRYEGIWPRTGEAELVKFGFALTQADGIKIRNWLEEGKTVKVQAKVDAKIVLGTNPVLTAVLPGEDTSKEVWLIAHICHPNPGANDNASGSASLMEGLRTISRLIKDGKLKKPAYSIRFIWVIFGPRWK